MIGKYIITVIVDKSVTNIIEIKRKPLGKDKLWYIIKVDNKEGHNGLIVAKRKLKAST